MTIAKGGFEKESVKVAARGEAPEQKIECRRKTDGAAVQRNGIEGQRKKKSDSANVHQGVDTHLTARNTTMVEDIGFGLASRRYKKRKKVQRSQSPSKKIVQKIKGS